MNDPKEFKQALDRLATVLTKAQSVVKGPQGAVVGQITGCLATLDQTKLEGIITNLKAQQK